MSRWRLSQIAAWCDGRLAGPDIEVDGVSIDTRKPAQGSLFVALAGPRFDGHDFILGPGEPEAAAVMVQRPVNGDFPRIDVKDTLKSLARFAAGWRGELGACVIALTGSNGKTTVKEMLSSILSRNGDTLVTRGNLNNHIGVPLTLLEVTQAHRYAVIEMGANHAGEIAALTALAQPRVALITNAGPAHLEGFGSLEGVACAKGEIYASLGADGVAVINGDDRFAPYWLKLNQGREILRFGIDTKEAEIRGRITDDGRLHICTPSGEVAARLTLPGKHNRMNALAAAAAAFAAGAELDTIRAGLESMRSIPGRLRRLGGIHGMTLLDDCYNANPGSLEAGLRVLGEMPAPRWLVFADMAELGQEATKMHAEIGSQARELGVDRVFAIGSLSTHTVKEFGEGGMHFPSIEDMIETIAGAARQSSRAPSLLIKGSRAMRLERVVQAFAMASHEEADDAV